MNIPTLTRSKTSPLIIVKSRPEPLILPRDTFRSSGYCTNCNKWYGWRVNAIHPHLAESEQQYEDQERALSLWLQYKRKGWCDRCIPQPYRTFIAINATGVVYS